MKIHDNRNLHQTSLSGYNVEYSGGTFLTPPVIQLSAGDGRKESSEEFQSYEGKIVGTSLAAMRSNPHKDPNNPHGNTIADSDVKQTLQLPKFSNAGVISHFSFAISLINS